MSTCCTIIRSATEKKPGQTYLMAGLKECRKADGGARAFCLWNHGLPISPPSAAGAGVSKRHLELVHWWQIERASFQLLRSTLLNSLMPSFQVLFSFQKDPNLGYANALMIQNRIVLRNLVFCDTKPEFPARGSQEHSVHLQTVNGSFIHHSTCGFSSAAPSLRKRRTCLPPGGGLLQSSAPEKAPPTWSFS